MNLRLWFRSAMAAWVIASASNALAASDDHEYLPLEEGARWNFVAKVNGQGGSMMIRVASTQSVPGRQVAKLETLVNGRVTASEFLGTSDEGIFRLKMNDQLVSPPLQILRFPVKRGDSWSAESTAAGERLKVEVTVDLQKVTVPAGTYEAALVTTVAKTPAGKVTNQQWFARGIGPVKQEVRMPGATIVAELKRYDPAK